MIKIAICEDNLEERARLHEMMDVYEKGHESLELEIHVFSSVEELTAAALQGTPFQLLVLDIFLPKENGIAFAQQLRAKGEQVPVIFVTSSKDFALEAFGVDAVQYLLKPVSVEQLYPVLDKVFSALRAERAAGMTVSTQDGIKNLFYHSIVYIECERHLVYFRLSDGNLICTKTLRQSFADYIRPLLEEGRFMRTHHSFVVNKQYVSRLNQRDFEMYGGFTVPISRSRLAEVKKGYLGYLDQRTER